MVQCADSTDVYLDIAQNARRGLTLLHLSSRINLSPLSKESFILLHDRVKKKQWDVIRTEAARDGAEGLSYRNYLYAAVRLGAVREIYWILPSKVLGYIDAERRVQALLASDAYGFGPEEVKSLRYKKGCVTGSLSGATVNICGIETLPPVPGTVVLDVDAGFFPMYARERGMTALEGAKVCFDQLFTRSIKVSEAYVRSTLREGTQSPLYAHITSYITDILKDPNVVRQAPPELWFLSNAAASMLEEGAAAEAEAFLDGALKKHPRDRTLVMLSGIASALGDRPEKGRRALSSLCASDREACYALDYVAQRARQPAGDTIGR